MNQEGTDEGGPSPAQRLLGLIAEHRATIREALDPEQHALLVHRLTALAEVEPGEVRAVARALQGVRRALVPLPLDHPVQHELDGVRLVGSAPPGPETVVAARELTGLLGNPPPDPVPDASPEPPCDPVSPPALAVNTAREGLLRAPALSVDEARARCGSAPPPELIRLARPGEGDRYPAFQFAAGDGSPRGVVLEVNRVLLADIDPWGAAAWWLGGNSWLGGTPAALLGERPDHELLDAATALAEGD